MLTDLKGRTRRLEALTQGLALEMALRRAGADPLLYAERRQYLTGLQNAIDGLETARVVLVQAAQRLAVGEEPPQGPAEKQDQAGHVGLGGAARTG